MEKKLAYDLTNESTTRVMAMDGTTAEDVINARNLEKFNQQVDDWNERFEKHSTNLKDFAEKINVKDIEIMPVFGYVLVKPFEENPFQRIVRDSKSGLIIDTGGLAPEYKNTDSGEIEQEKNLFKVGVVQEVGHRCEILQPGDTVIYPVVAAVPVPFYKQGLESISENRVLAVVNEGLSERFAEFKNNKK